MLFLRKFQSLVSESVSLWAGKVSVFAFPDKHSSDGQWHWCASVVGEEWCWHENLHVWSTLPRHHCCPQQVQKAIVGLQTKFVLEGQPFMPVKRQFSDTWWHVLTFSFHLFKITIFYRATSALRLRFEVCPELRNHMELLPKTGYIQAQSTFSAQLKFLPRWVCTSQKKSHIKKTFLCKLAEFMHLTCTCCRQSLASDAGQYFNPETGVLQAPMKITVADQVKSSSMLFGKICRSSFKVRAHSLVLLSRMHSLSQVCLDLLFNSAMNTWLVFVAMPNVCCYSDM